MTLAMWPPAPFPQRVLREPFSLGFGEPRMIQEMDDGSLQTRPKNSKSIRPVTGGLDLSVIQVAEFERFVMEDTDRGVRPFLIPGQIFDGVGLLDEDGELVLNDEGEQLLVSAWWLCMFAKGGLPMLTKPHRGLYYQFTFQLVILPV
ncbi:MAG: hypothetical protein AB7P16_28695 [Bradyrhizobium sp.]|uniref:hypothetical protein n=1 Tax=Bradyrhizobium sp. TaxID=376 RepID=UPI003D0AB7D9